MNSSVRTTTSIGLVSGFLKPMTKVSTMMPITSSMMALDIISVPISPLSLPSSFRVCTVMPTEVAVIIVPMNTARRNSSEPIFAKP